LKPRAKKEQGDVTKQKYRLHGMLQTEVKQQTSSPMNLPKNEAGKKVPSIWSTDMHQIPSILIPINTEALELAFQADVALTKLHLKNANRIAFAALRFDPVYLDAWRVLASCRQFSCDNVIYLHQFRELYSMHALPLPITLHNPNVISINRCKPHHIFA
jgi:hypothetical protein